MKYLAFLLFIVSSIGICACVTPPDSVIVNLFLDDENCELLVEVTNLQMYGGDPNEFCSCGINDRVAGLGDIEYIAFVDSATDEPLLGFEQFLQSGFADDSWGDVSPDYDWSGFVSTVNESGLVAGQTVKLWIKIDLFDIANGPDGFSFDPCQDLEFAVFEVLPQGTIGTDMWNEVDQELSLDHNGIAFFENSIELETVPQGALSYYDDIIEQFYTSIEEDVADQLTIYPNPGKDRFQIRHVNSTVSEIKAYDSRGQIMDLRPLSQTSFDTSSWPAGLYYLDIGFGDIRRSLRYIKH